MGCQHLPRWIKKVYTHGYNSKPYLFCKKCGEILKKYELKQKGGMSKR